MTVATAIAPRILLGVLALWLALWPAADGATGASKVLVPGSAGERPGPIPMAAPAAATPCAPVTTTPCAPAAATPCAPAAPSPCAPAAATPCAPAAPSPPAPAGAVAAASAGGCCSGAPEDEVPAATPGCCPEPCNGPAAVPTCPAGKAARCSACCGAGGMVLFATAIPSLEADQAMVGTLCPCCQVGSSRHLQPPVPPPWPVV